MSTSWRSKISAFKSPRKSTIAGSCKPRSMFQSTMRRELRGQVNHRKGAKFSAMISSFGIKQEVDEIHPECQTVSRDSSLKSKGPWCKLGKYALLGKTQVQWIINFGPGQSVCAGIAYVNSFVCQFLHRDIEELIQLAAGDEIVHSGKKCFLDGTTKDCDPDIGTAEVLP